IIGTLVLIFLPLSTVVKLFVRRARPQTIYTETMKIKTYSFPSSHAYSAALAGGYMAAMAYALLPDPWNGIVSLIVIAVIAAIGISRVHVGAHYPSDVTVGWMAGIAVLLVILYS
ncbi:MAG TPA: phosphatase PAP2 family protein, partial [Candidatus Saccharimonadales bacterium]|nr:phosphatase PAP2 family protein [Candidatus Saccharimonadales bacterium]